MEQGSGAYLRISNIRILLTYSCGEEELPMLVVAGRKSRLGTCSIFIYMKRTLED